MELWLVRTCGASITRKATPDEVRDAQFDKYGNQYITDEEGYSCRLIAHDELWKEDR